MTLLKQKAGHASGFRSKLPGKLQRLWCMPPTSIAQHNRLLYLIPTRCRTQSLSSKISPRPARATCLDVTPDTLPRGTLFPLIDAAATLIRCDYIRVHILCDQVLIENGSKCTACQDWLAGCRQTHSAMPMHAHGCVTLSTELHAPIFASSIYFPAPWCTGASLGPQLSPQPASQPAKHSK